MKSIIIKIKKRWYFIRPYCINFVLSILSFVLIYRVFQALISTEVALEYFSYPLEAKYKFDIILFYARTYILPCFLYVWLFLKTKKNETLIHITIYSLVIFYFFNYLSLSNTYFLSKTFFQVIIYGCIVLKIVSILYLKFYSENKQVVEWWQTDEAIKRVSDNQIKEWEPSVNHLQNKIIKAIDNEEKISISISAPWGHGKSSYVKLLHLSLKKDTKFNIIDFKPWVYSSGDNYLKVLINEISSSTGNILDRIYLREYIDHLIPDNMKFWGYILSKIVPKNELEMENRVEKILRRNPCIVLIDDLDRLEADEILSVFKMIRGSLYLKNIIFLTCLDRKQTCKILDQEPVYLEKFFDSNTFVPPISNIRKEKIFFDICRYRQLDSGLLSNITIDNVLLPHAFDTIREMKLFFNYLETKLKLISYFKNIENHKSSDNLINLHKYKYLHDLQQNCNDKDIALFCLLFTKYEDCITHDKSFYMDMVKYVEGKYEGIYLDQLNKLLSHKMVRDIVGSLKSIEDKTFIYLFILDNYSLTALSKGECKKIGLLLSHQDWDLAIEKYSMDKSDYSLLQLGKYFLTFRDTHDNLNSFLIERVCSGEIEFLEFMSVLEIIDFDIYKELSEWDKLFNNLEENYYGDIPIKNKLNGLYLFKHALYYSFLHSSNNQYLNIYKCLEANLAYLNTIDINEYFKYPSLKSGLLYIYESMIITRNFNLFEFIQNHEIREDDFFSKNNISLLILVFNNWFNRNFFDDNIRSNLMSEDKDINNIFNKVKKMIEGEVNCNAVGWSAAFVELFILKLGDWRLFHEKCKQYGVDELIISINDEISSPGTSYSKLELDAGTIKQGYSSRNSN